MKTSLKKALSIFLCICMMTTMMSVTAVPVTAVANSDNASQVFSIASTTSSNVFTITRAVATEAATVNYCTVDCSAVAGQHFTGASGTLTFNIGEKSKTVTVTETSRGSISNIVSRYQRADRVYKLKIWNVWTPPLYCTRTLAHNNDSYYIDTSIFDSKVVYTSSSEKKHDDDHSWKSSPYTGEVDSMTLVTYATATYLKAIGCKKSDEWVRLSFSAKESEDGGENMQLRFSDSLSDTAPNIYYTPDGANWVQNSSGTNYSSSTPTWYKKFDLNLASGNGTMSSYVNVSLPQYFTGSTTAVSVTGEDGKTYSVNYEKSSSDSSYNKYLLTSANNSYKSNYYIAPTSSSSGVYSYAHIAYAGSGNGEDTWYTKNLSVSLHINDSIAPKVKAVYAPKGELRNFEKTTIAVEFSEVVATSNTTTTPIVLTTNCGTFNYTGGTGTNILYFDGIVTAATASSLNITGFTGSVKDYAGNSYSYSSTNTPSASINVVSAQPKNGTGTSASPYEITTPEELN